MESVYKFIMENWKNTLVTKHEDEGTLIGLPYTYNVACIKKDEMFREIYYWGTYFTNTGLILCNNVAQAKNNVDNFLYLVKKYGFVPNGNRTFFLNRSQPPFLSEMVKDIFNNTNDLEWLKTAFDVLKIEYDFWQTKRITPSGLNRYFGDILNKDECVKDICERYCVAEPTDEKSRNLLAETFISGAESGWDFSSRYGLAAADCNFVDLNSLLYGFEKNMEYFAEKLNLDEITFWEERAEKRKELMNKLMFNNNILAFNDYNFKNKTKRDFISCAVFYPLFTKLATQEQANTTVKLLEEIEFDFGVAATANYEDIKHLQWDFPHAWPPLQLIIMRGLLNYRFVKDAKRIAQKYINAVDESFIKTNKLWEKYNACDGSVSITKEYATPAMMGWTAAIYLFSKNLIESKD